MAQRNARRRPKKNIRTNTKKSQPLRGWLWFATGLCCSLLAVFLYHLTTLPPKPSSNAPGKATAQQQKPAAGLKFNFYDTLRQRTVKADPPKNIAPPKAETRNTAQKPTAQKNTRPPNTAPTNSKPRQPYFLQAGSFKQREQAEKRRIELLLLDTDANITRIKHNGKPWYRVRTGPYDSAQQVDTIRGKLLNEGIETMVTRR